MLTALRSRWLPASGAKVMLDFLRGEQSSATSTLNESTRVLGSEMPIPSPNSERRARTMSAIWLWSVLLSDTSESSSKPVLAKSSRAPATTSSGVRSRSGR